jgi:hypothetical protein
MFKRIFLSTVLLVPLVANARSCVSGAPVCVDASKVQTLNEAWTDLFNHASNSKDSSFTRTCESDNSNACTLRLSYTGTDGLRWAVSEQYLGHTLLTRVVCTNPSTTTIRCVDFDTWEVLNIVLDSTGTWTVVGK